MTINVFRPDVGNDICMGQTWYLSVDMIFFFLSPLVVYPLWRAKFGRAHKIVAFAWWGLLMATTLVGTFVWTYYKAEEAANAQKFGIPPWNFSPWGYR